MPDPYAFTWRALRTLREESQAIPVSHPVGMQVSGLMAATVCVAVKVCRLALYAIRIYCYAQLGNGVINTYLCCLLIQYR